MKKSNLFFIPVIAAVLLFSSCGSERPVMKTDYSSLGIAQQSPMPISAEKQTEKLLRSQKKTAEPIAKAGEEKASLISPRVLTEVNTPSKQEYLIQSHKRKNVGASINLETENLLKKPAPNAAEESTAGGDRSWIVALLLVLLLGAFGVHRLYLGYTATGILQLVMLLVGIPLSLVLIGIPILVALSVWVTVDLIRIIVGELKPKHGSYTDSPWDVKKPADKGGTEI
jgi:TM2 domain-containing membrane protein YozV